ncbi:MAG: acyltransferase family protein [Deltaproteobacteria bacterium]
MADESNARAPAPGAHHPALDGLRGVAVLLVLGFHFLHIDGEGGPAERFLLGATRSGWAGVDLFFVLSGFLITGILLDARGGRATSGPSTRGGCCGSSRSTTPTWPSSSSSSRRSFLHST